MKYDIQKNYTSLKHRKTETERELKEFLEKTIITGATEFKMTHGLWENRDRDSDRERERERE